MEHIIDVSWMDHSRERSLSKQLSHEKPASPPPRRTSISSQHLEAVPPSEANGNPHSSSTAHSTQNSSTQSNGNAIPAAQQNSSGKNSSDEKKPPGPTGTPPQRRNSWFSRIASGLGSNTATTPEALTDEPTPLPKISPSRNAVLPHAARQTGEGPYVPAPPKNGQAGFMRVFRRNSSNVNTAPMSAKSCGLVDRRVMNIDKQRERPRCHELNQAKLRRVAFCVDLEIAPMPKYAEPETNSKKKSDKTEKRKLSEKGEGEALKHPKAVEERKQAEDAKKVQSEEQSKEAENAPNGTANGQLKEGLTTPSELPKSESGTTRKKEKKKKSEAERKAKKEKRRREALEKGAIPMELHLDTESSTEEDSISSETPRPQIPTVFNPARIYRRCCQLRETDILTKITAQLPKTNVGFTNGIVEKLDLTDYPMNLTDLITLGDFLAVVPVKEVILENCGLSDEGVRVVLAGLLASKKPSVRHRKPVTSASDLAYQGGVVERLVLKNSKLGAEGWRHICLFIHMCRSIKCLDLSCIPFPNPIESPKTPLSPRRTSSAASQVDLASVLSKAIGERLAGPELELLNLGETGIKGKQLGTIVDGLLKCGLSRLGLANNDFDSQCLEHVARYLRGGKCQGLDLGGNDLRDQMGTIAEAISEDNTLWALSLANCNLKPKSLCSLMPKLAKLTHFKFIDLSHNHDLCKSEPSAIGLLRRYLPKTKSLRRLHLADVAMSSEQAIALVEVLPESGLAHINLLENPELEALADAKTEELQEEACALYASLLAAARTSEYLVKIDIDNPTAESGEIVKALANQVVAYCLRNLRMSSDLSDSSSGEQPTDVRYPDVLRHLVGYEEDSPIQEVDPDDIDAARDDDYVIGGTGVVRALAACLKNRGVESGRQTPELVKEPESGAVFTRHVHHGKAKHMSMHLLASARKIRARLQPALAQAKSSPGRENYARLQFLDSTLASIIDRFENEFPEARQESKPIPIPSRTGPANLDLGLSQSPDEVEGVSLSDAEDLDTEVRSRSNSIISHTSKALEKEEGRALRVGHKFRRGFLRQEHYELLTCEDIRLDEQHMRLISTLLDELEDESLKNAVAQKGPLRVWNEDREAITKAMRDKDPAYWDSFIESQEKARANVNPRFGRGSVSLSGGLGKENGHKEMTTTNPSDESAIVD